MTCALGLLLIVLPSVVDSTLNVVFGFSRRRGGTPAEPGSPTRWLVLVPARQEGKGIEPTLRSVATALSEASGSDALLVLDGADPEAAEAAARAGIRCVVKEPEGPSKGALLTWAAARLREEIRRFDGVLVLDRGNRVASGFLSLLSLPDGADAVQAYVSGSGTGIAGAAIRSDNFSQGWEDQGRLGLGWSARLRGFGMGIRSAAFLRVVPLARTRVEDWEYSLLIPASGGRIVLAGPGVGVLDEKVTDPRAAAAQRARWFSGQWHLAAVQSREIGRWILRSPLQGLAFAAEIGARPFALTIPLRLVVAAILFIAGSAWAGAIVLASALATIGCLAAAGALTLRGGVGLAAAWLHALALLPSAATRWMRSRP